MANAINNANANASNAVSTANTANSTANTAKSTASNAASTANAAKSTADNAKNTANSANNKIDNLKVGGRNLWKKTKEYDAKNDTFWVDNNNGVRGLASLPYTTVNGFGVQRIYNSSNKQEVIFHIPLSRPIMSTPVSISSINGLTIRQNGKYIYNSTASKPIKPASYTAAVIGGRNGLNVRAKMGIDSNGFTDTDIKNIVNNDTCAIMASIKITF